jgi:hypothetical protein
LEFLNIKVLLVLLGLMSIEFLVVAEYVFAYGKINSLYIQLSCTKYIEVNYIAIVNGFKIKLDDVPTPSEENPIEPVGAGCFVSRN